VAPVGRFLRHVLDSGCSPNTAATYGYDLRYLFEFLAERQLNWREFRPAVALELLGGSAGHHPAVPRSGWLWRRRSLRAGCWPPATVARVMAAVSRLRVRGDRRGIRGREPVATARLYSCWAVRGLGEGCRCPMPRWCGCSPAGWTSSGCARPTRPHMRCGTRTRPRCKCAGLRLMHHWTWLVIGTR